MRIALIVVVSLILAACGGDSSPSGPDKPSSTPASITALSGDLQQGEPGKALTTAPVVIVRDANGATVSGVTVRFAVTAGGGSIKTASVVTSNTGTASPGTWTLGASPGRNELRATAGSLPPLTLVATAAVGVRSLADTTLTAGTVTVKADGPFNGTTLVIPSGAFPSSNYWTLSEQSTAAWPRRPGVTFDPVALRIAGTASGLASKMMTLTLPAVEEAGQKTFVIMRDQTSGNLTVLNTIDRTPTSITVAVNHLTGSSAASASAAMAPAASLSGMRAGYDAVVVVGNIPVAELDKDYDTGFRPGVDDWDFRSTPTAITGNEPIDLGKAIGQMVYYGYLRSNGALYKKFRLQQNEEFSNRYGIKASAYLQNLLPTDRMFAGLTAIRQSTRAGAADQIFYDVLKANLIVSGLPQLLVAEFRSPEPSDAFELLRHLKFFTAYRTSGGNVMIADPNRPGDATIAVQFANGRFVAPSVPIGMSGKVLVADDIDVIAPSTWLDMKFLSTELATILDGGWPEVIAVDGPILTFPKAEIKTRNFATMVIDGTMYLADTARMWVECPRCERSLVNAALTAGRIQPFNLYDENSTLLGTSLAAGVLVEERESRDDFYGLLMFHSSNLSQINQWLDWQPLRIKQWSMKFTPEAPSGSPGTDLPIAIEVRGPATPSDRVFTWDFGDNTGVLAVNSDLAVTHKYTQAGSYKAIVSMYARNTDVLLARDTVRVTVGDRSWAGWKIQTFQVSTNYGKRNDQVSPSVTRWMQFKQQLANGTVDQQLVDIVNRDSTEFAQMADGTLPGAIVYLSKDTLTRSPPGSVAYGYNSRIGAYFVTGTSVPTPDLVMAYSLDPFSRMLASPSGNLTFGPELYNSCDSPWDWSYTTTGNPLSGAATINGAAWSNIKSYVVNRAYPRRRPTINATIDAQGNMTGTMVFNYRLNVFCGQSDDDNVAWKTTITFTATRIR